jgi:hypothetical protein
MIGAKLIQKRPRGQPHGQLLIKILKTESFSANRLAALGDSAELFLPVACFLGTELLGAAGTKRHWAAELSRAGD